MTRTTRFCTVVVGLVAAAMIPFLSGVSPTRAGEAENTDLERFLPNSGNSLYNATGLLRKWPAEGPKKLWQVEVGWGKSVALGQTGTRD